MFCPSISLISDHSLRVKFHHESIFHNPVFVLFEDLPPCPCQECYLRDTSRCQNEGEEETDSERLPHWREERLQTLQDFKTHWRDVTVHITQSASSYWAWNSGLCLVQSLSSWYFNHNFTLNHQHQNLRQRAHAQFLSGIGSTDILYLSKSTNTTL